MRGHRICPRADRGASDPRRSSEPPRTARRRRIRTTRTHRPRGNGHGPRALGRHEIGAGRRPRRLVRRRGAVHYLIWTNEGGEPGIAGRGGRRSSRCVATGDREQLWVSQILWPFVALRPLRCQRGRVARPSAGDAQGRAACATSRSDEVRKEPRRPQREAGALGLLSAAGHSTAPRARRVIDSSAAAGAVGRRRRGGCRRPGGSSGGRGRGRGSPRSSSGPCP